MITTTNPSAVRRASSLTLSGLLRGRVYTHKLASGETITVGRHTPAVGPIGWAIYGYNRGACRAEVFGRAIDAVARLLELAGVAS